MSSINSQTKTRNVPELRFPGFHAEWKDIRFGSFITERSEFPKEKYPLYSLTIEKGITPKTERYERSFLVKSEEEAYKVVHPNDFAYNPMNLRFGALARHRAENKVLVSKYYNIFHSNELVDPGFLEAYLTRDKMIRFYNRMSTGSLEEKKRVHYLDFINFVKPFPDLGEQKKIAAFLESAYLWIENLRAQKVALESYKKGMLQKIFSQEVRFKDQGGKSFPGWEDKKLGDYLTLSSKRNKTSDIDLVLSVSNRRGFIEQSEQFEDHRVASKDVTNYKIVEKGDFGYNPSRINVGSIACLKNFDRGIVSPMYVVFRLKSSLLNEFFENFIQTHLFKHLVKVGCSGSVRDTLNFEVLEKFKVSVPSLKEQQKIVEFMSSLDELLVLKQRHITKAEQWNKSLLQKLFV